VVHSSVISPDLGPPGVALVRSPVRADTDGVQDVEVPRSTIELVAASALHADRPLRVLHYELEPFGIPLFSMTTGGLWRLAGTAMDDRGTRRFHAVLKVVHTPLRWAGIDAIPVDMRGYIVAHVPWRTEAEVYRSDLANFLPAGLRLPDMYLIEDLDEDSAGIWMEDVQTDPARDWNNDCYTQVAYLLGYLAGVPGAPTGMERDIADFVTGPGEHVFVPMLRSGILHSHPAFDGTIDHHLEQDMLLFVDHLPSLLAEAATLPRTRAHGDACPQNMLQTRTGTVALDWGSFGTTTAGFDLGQLLAGRANEGLLDGPTMAMLAPACLSAYLDGLLDAGMSLPPALVRRGFGISMAFQSGLSALFPRELEGPVTAELRDLIRARAGMARFILDELTATAPHP
jgi:hypothetical protein